MSNLCSEISDWEKIATIPKLEVEEGTLSVPLQILALQIADPIQPFTVKSDIVLQMFLAFMSYFAIHLSFNLLNNKVGLEFTGRLLLSQRH